MTPMQIAGNNVMNALTEGSVATIINLYDRAQLAPRFYRENFTREEAIKTLLIESGMDEESVNYWFDWFKIT
jgi:hypothetical protein